MIDHLIRDVYKPRPSDEKHVPRSPTTATGLPAGIRSTRNGILVKVFPPFDE